MPQNPADTAPAIGVEIADAATRLTVARDDGHGSLRRWQTKLDVPPDPDACVDALVALITRALAEEGISPRAVHIGIAAWGAVDGLAGVVRALPPLPAWDGYPLAENLIERLSPPSIRIESATTAAALAEAHALIVAQAQDQHIASPLLYVSLARTVTSALVVWGNVVHGALGGEGKLGHWLVRPDDPTAPRCACGVRGHLDPLASAQSIVRNTIGRAAATDESTAAMLRVSDGRAEAMTAPQVVALAAAGDPAAAAVVDEAIAALALALANLSAVLAPAAIIIGGPLAAAGDAYFAPLRARVAALCAPAVAAPPIIPAALEPRAALLGAWRMAAEAAEAATPRVPADDAV